MLGALVAKRPPFREAVAVDLSRLTPELRQAWDELYSDLCESGCQATLFELWEFDRLCELDLGEFPNWPSELREELGRLGRYIRDYKEHARLKRAQRLAEYKRLSDDEKQQPEWRDLYERDPDGALSVDRDTSPNELEVAYDPGGTPDFPGVTGDDPFIERRLEELRQREPRERRIAEQGDKWTLPETWRRYEDRLYAEALRMDAERGRWRGRDSAGTFPGSEQTIVPTDSAISPDHCGTNWRLFAVRCR